MKRIVFIALTTITLMLTACGKSAIISPEIKIDKILVNGKEPTSEKVHVQDTIEVYMLLQPYYDKVLYLQTNLDRTILTDSTMSDKDFKELCDETASDRKKGYYVFKNLNDGDAIYLSPAKVIVEKYPMSGSNDMVVDYEMKSTANVKAEYNPTHQRIKFTIVAKEE